MRVRHIIRTVVVPDNRYVLRHATSATFQFLDAATSQHIVLAYHCVECSTVIEQQITPEILRKLVEGLR